MWQPDSTNLRRLCGVALAMVLAVGPNAAPLRAQSGVEMGTGETVLHLLDDNGNVAVDFDVDDLGVTQEITIGRADPVGGDEVNIDVRLVDASSTLSATDVAILLDASASDIRLGSGSATEPGDDGDLFIEDGMGVTVIDIQGSDGDINQDIDNTGTTTDFTMNGAVKAWAIIFQNGVVDRCWKCSTSGANTQQLSGGEYEVDFILGSIDKRPYLVSLGCTIPGLAGFQCSQDEATVSVSPRLGDASSVYVRIDDSGGGLADRAFTVVVF